MHTIDTWVAERRLEVAKLTWSDGLARPIQVLGQAEQVRKKIVPKKPDHQGQFGPLGRGPKKARKLGLKQWPDYFNFNFFQKSCIVL